MSDPRFKGDVQMWVYAKDDAGLERRLVRYVFALDELVEACRLGTLRALILGRIFPNLEYDVVEWNGEAGLTGLFRRLKQKEPQGA